MSISDLCICTCISSLFKTNLPRTCLCSRKACDGRRGYVLRSREYDTCFYPLFLSAKLATNVGPDIFRSEEGCEDDIDFFRKDVMMSVGLCRKDVCIRITSCLLLQRLMCVPRSLASKDGKLCGSWGNGAKRKREKLSGDINGDGQ